MKKMMLVVGLVVCLGVAGCEMEKKYDPKPDIIKLARNQAKINNIQKKLIQILRAKKIIEVRQETVPDFLYGTQPKE